MKRSTRSRAYQWYLIGILWAVGLLLGISGYLRYSISQQLGYTLWDDLYLTLQLISVNSGAVGSTVPVELNIARFALPILAAATAIKTFFSIFRSQMQLFRLRWIKGHVIICGLSRKGFLLATRFQAKGGKVVVIERDEENIWIESCREQGITVVIGNACEPSILLFAGAMSAQSLFAVCDQDEVNVEIAMKVQLLSGRRKKGFLSCLIHISDPQLCSLLQKKELALTSASFNLRWFNVFEQGARLMLRDFPAWDSISDGSLPSPRLLLIGLGRLGENIIVQTARDWWSTTKTLSTPLSITVIDQEVHKKLESLLIRYPRLKQICHFVPLEMNVFSPEFEKANFLGSDQGTPCVDRIYVCMDQDAVNLRVGLTLNQKLRGHALPIILRMAETTGMAALLEHSSKEFDPYANLFAFGLLDHTCTPDLRESSPRTLLARAAHEHFLNYHPNHGNSRKPSGHLPLKSWEDLDESHRQANYRWVDHIFQLLNAVDLTVSTLEDWDAAAYQFKEGQLEQMAVMEHQLWCQDLYEDGWKHAPVAKNLSAKTHPLLIPWEKLPEEEKEKNRAFIRQIHSSLARAGYQVSRVEEHD